jgi:y4mF family transcriptional regulator
MKFGITIKERRAVLGLTQQDLAEMSGVGLRTIKNIEGGKGNPSINTLTRIAEVLGMELQIVIKKINES